MISPNPNNLRLHPVSGYSCLGIPAVRTVRRRFGKRDRELHRGDENRMLRYGTPPRRRQHDDGVGNPTVTSPTTNGRRQGPTTNGGRHSPTTNGRTTNGRTQRRKVEPNDEGKNPTSPTRRLRPQRIEPPTRMTGDKATRPTKDGTSNQSAEGVLELSAEPRALLSFFSFFFFPSNLFHVPIHEPNWVQDYWQYMC